MECTQRLECTQDEYGACFERICHEQIGFLGLCGSKQPVKKGPNKIGRDPQTCSIVLNDNSISRHHAVINVLNKKDFMLMDLDSSNKTKLMGKALQPYIPHPLKNGDTVQFGQVFGIFRLLEEDDDLPMTQAVEIPDTPVTIRHVSRLKPASVTTVPESPDVSDRDDSIICQSQPKKPQFKSPNNNIIKSSGKIISTQPFGTNKIDNVYWSSSKKSDSFSSNYDTNTSFTIVKSSVSPKKSVDSSIYDMETQPPALLVDQTADSIYEANTQVPSNLVSQNIYNCETQVPNIEKLPEIFKVRDQSNVQLNLYSTNEKFDIFEAETQVVLQDKAERVTPTFSSTIDTNTHEQNVVSAVQKKFNSSDEEICFDEIYSQPLEDECESQPLLPSDDPCGFDNVEVPIINPEKTQKRPTEKRTFHNDVHNDSDSKDCDEILPSQDRPEKPRLDDEDITDCEDNMIELVVNVPDKPSKIQSDDDVTDCEDESSNVKNNNKKKSSNDDLTDCEDDVIEISQNRSKHNNLSQNFEDLPTQVIGEENFDEKGKSQCEKVNVAFEDMLTQVIEECPVESNAGLNVVNNTDKSVSLRSPQTQVSDNKVIEKHSSSMLKSIENNNSFKRPISSPRLKKRDTTPLKNTKCTSSIKETVLESKDECDLNYYDATQQIFNDLCSQKEQLDDHSGSKIEKRESSTETNVLIKERSSEDSDSTDRINNVVSNLSNEQVREVIGVDTYVAPLSKKISSDSSDFEVTPKKFNPSKFLMIDLPNSQEIRSCDFISSKIDVSDSSDELEDNMEQKNTKHSSLITSHRKKKRKDVKMDLMKKFDNKTLPSRTITRIRKPTSEILESDRDTKKIAEQILQTEFDIKHEVTGGAIQLNLKKIDTKIEKGSNKINSRSRKLDKEGNFALQKHNESEQNLRNNKNKSKEQKLKQNKEKELKQQSIKSMFKEPISKDITVLEASKGNKTESIDSSRENRRSSRNKSKGDKELIKPEVKEVKSEAREKKTSSDRKHSSRKHDKGIDLTKDSETTVRRSKRHQTNIDPIEHKKDKSRSLRSSKERKDSSKPEKLRSITPENKSNTKANNEQSAVYNLSSETVDSPVSLKRQATSDIYTSKTKRAKPSAANETVRATPLRGVRTQYVLTTAFPCEEVKVKLQKLGAVIVSEVKACTVVLTLQIRRTIKLLCALGLGKPIVGPNWVQACADSNMIVDPWLYLIKDEATEKRFGFNLRQSLTCKRNFLKGYNVYCTPNVTPSAQEMQSIVECSGGTWKEGGRSWFCVSCPADKALWPGLRRRGATLVSTEFILGGVLQQRINLDRDKLG